jgi:hypothetical protein
MVRRDRSYNVDRGRTTSAIRGEGSGASGDFGLKQTRWRAEGRQAAKHKCLISSRFPSLTRVTGGSPAAEHGLLSADAPEPYWFITHDKACRYHYGQWRRDGRRISTSAVEGTVNRLIGRRFGKGQHMCWTKQGAHLLLQVRCAVLNGELLSRFQRWFPYVGTRQIGLPWNWLPHHS